MNYIVITEIFENGTCERWYYGTYSRDRANEVALSLGSDRANGIFHSVIPESDAEAYGVKNMP